MNKFIAKLMLMAGLLFMAVAKTHAVVISTSFAQQTIGVTNSILIRRGESVYYAVTSTSANLSGTMKLQYSKNGSVFQDTDISTASSTSGYGAIGYPTPFSGVAYADEYGSDTVYFRWKVLLSSGTEFVLTLKDQDDPVSVLKNNKRADVVSFYDDSIRLAGSLFSDRFQLQGSSNATVIELSSATQLKWGAEDPVNKRYSLNRTTIDKTFSVIRSTSGESATTGAITLVATPTISTQTATNGDLAIFHCRTSSITFQDNSTLSGSALRLGATTRALGLGDILAMLFHDGYWYEFFFVNNVQ